MNARTAQGRSGTRAFARIAAGFAAALALAGACGMTGGFAPAGAQAEEAAATTAGETAAEEAATPTEADAAGQAAIDEIYAGLAEQAEEYAPEVVTLEDGTQVQRTPTDPGGYFQMGYANNTNYNTYYLNADNRGCASCHTDLAQLVADMDFFHLELSNGYGSDVTVGDCLMCHDQGYGYVEQTQEFGSLIHGIHTRQAFKDMGGDCMSCHTATANGDGLELWDLAKYDVLQGITDVADPQGTFSYDQTTTSDFFGASWFYGPTNVENIGKQLAGVEEDPAVFDTWEITVSGLVDESFSMTLTDLIATAPSETFIATNQCIMNPPGGEQVSNMELTGVPISWLLEQAGVQEGATAVMSVAPDGWSRGVPLELLEESGGYLVYEVNGELLDYDDGFPVMTFYPGWAAPSCIRWVSELQVVDTPLDELKIWTGWTDSDGTGINEYNGGHMYSDAAAEQADEVFFVNKPNVGILHFHEGQIIPAGEAYTFEGYATAFDEQVVAVEFSLDGGQTWTSYDTSDSDYTKWVYWRWSFTPETASSYVLQVRAVTDTGKVSYQPDTVMFTVK